MGATTYSEGPTITLTAGSVLDPNVAVKLNSSGLIVVATASDIPLGFTNDDCDAAASGDGVAVRLLGKGGTVKAIQTAAIAIGAEVYAAADGNVQPKPSAAGTYYRIGVKVGPSDGGSGAASDIIEIADTAATAVTVTA